MPRKPTKALHIHDIRRKQKYVRDKNGRFTSVEKQERRQLMIYLAIIFCVAAACIVCGYLHDHVGYMFVSFIKLLVSY